MATEKQNTGNGQRQARPWDGVPIPDNMRSETKWPTVQWVNWPHLLKQPRGLEYGGFFHADRFGAVPLPGSVPAQYREDSGVFTHHLTAAVLATRWSWVESRGEGRKKSWVKIFKYRAGARKRVEALILVKGENGTFMGPLKLTMIGTANDALTEAMEAFGIVASAANAQPWMFWGDLDAVKMEARGEHGTEMTPLWVKMPAPAELDTAYIGADAVQLVTSLAAEIAEWREDWKNLADEEPEAEIVDTDPFEAAKDVRVRTKKHGDCTLGAMQQQDPAYAKQVREYIIANPAKYKPEQVEAAKVLTQALDLPQAGDEDPAV